MRWMWASCSVWRRSMAGSCSRELAVDAIEAIWELPNIQTFVLVSGDRDFIHVLKALRRHGKTVIGVAPDNAVSEDFAALCDRFVAYSALQDVQSEQVPEITDETSLPPIQTVKVAVRTVLRSR